MAGLWDDWLARHRPERRERVLGRVREILGGKLNDPRWDTRMRGEGVYAESIRALFHLTCRRLGLNQEPLNLSGSAFRHPGPRGQLGLFDAA